MRKEIQILEKRREKEEEAGEEGEEEEEDDYETVREVADAAFQEFDTKKERQLAYDIVDKANDVTDAKEILKRLHEEGFPDGEEEKIPLKNKSKIPSEPAKGGLQTPQGTQPPPLGGRKKIISY